MVLSRRQNIGQDHKLLTDDKSFENVENLKCLKQKWQIKIVFSEKLRADYILEMLAAFLFRVPFRILRTLRLIYKNTNLPVFVWVWHLVSYTKERTLIEGVWEQGAEENILT
jgi:hypothetical protein